jgi:hypothetical protein
MRRMTESGAVMDGNVNVHLPVGARGFKLHGVVRPLLEQTEAIGPQVPVNPVQKPWQRRKRPRADDIGLRGRTRFDPRVPTSTDTPVCRATSRRNAHFRVSLSRRAKPGARIPCARAQMAHTMPGKPPPDPRSSHSPLGFGSEIDQLDGIEEMPGPELRKRPIGHEIQPGLPFPENLLVDLQSLECFT